MLSKPSNIVFTTKKAAGGNATKPKTTLQIILKKLLNFPAFMSSFKG
jgi:hypothetical protein